MSRKVSVTMTFTAKVHPDRPTYGPHELADTIRFHVGVSDLDSIEADISAFTITNVTENLDAANVVERDAMAAMVRELADASARDRRGGTWVYDEWFRAVLASADTTAYDEAIRQAHHEGWLVGYHRGTLDATSDLEPADSPYRKAEE